MALGAWRCRSAGFRGAVLVAAMGGDCRVGHDRNRCPHRLDSGVGGQWQDRRTSFGRGPRDGRWHRSGGTERRGRHSGHRRGNSPDRGEWPAGRCSSGAGGTGCQYRCAGSSGRRCGPERALGGNVTRNALEDATRKLQAAGQEVERLAALFDQEQIQRAKFTVTAPLAGTVLIRGGEPGQTADATTVLFTLADTSPPVVQTEVDEAYAAQIGLGQDAVLQLVGESVPHPGKVSFVAPRVNPDTGALVVKITPDPVLTAPVGLTVTANIVVDRQPAALLAPRAALMSGNDPPAVLLLEGTTARKRAVTVIDWPAARLIVTSGLTAGDILITDAPGLSDGQTVKFVGP